jgi:hypothetical protein
MTSNKHSEMVQYFNAFLICCIEDGSLFEACILFFEICDKATNNWIVESSKYSFFCTLGRVHVKTKQL